MAAVLNTRFRIARFYVLSRATGPGTGLRPEEEKILTVARYRNIEPLQAAKIKNN